jgi:acyl-CoA reductase-like NAD-dependent aldehyde dehydrogenase
VDRTGGRWTIPTLTCVHGWGVWASQEGIYDRFVTAVVAQCKQMRMGAALGGEFVDCGALCMPHHAKHVQALIDDAVAKGAKVLLPHIPHRHYPLSPTSVRSFTVSQDQDTKIR